MLNLKANYISDAGAMALAKVARKSKTLRALITSSNDIEHAGELVLLLLLLLVPLLLVPLLVPLLLVLLLLLLLLVHLLLVPLLVPLLLLLVLVPLRLHVRARRLLRRHWACRREIVTNDKSRH